MHKKYKEGDDKSKDLVAQRIGRKGEIQTWTNVKEMEKTLQNVYNEIGKVIKK